MISLALLLSLTMASDPQLEASLNRFPARKAEWIALLERTGADKKEAVAYLLRDMPLADLRALPTTFVTRAVNVAYRAKKATAWSKSIPKEVFLDSVLPYASVTEPRDSMREEFQKRYLPVAVRAKSPGEAVLAIHATLFKDYKVVYDTNRLRTDQSARETIGQGMATCTGLSILLVEVLRSVGVPSRLAGIPSWPDSGGNHTWVEVWDNGWHYVGAAEPDSQGLDHAWFSEKAATAIADKPDNAIYAVTYRNAGAKFPLAWLPGESRNAENVTARYKIAPKVKGPLLQIEVRKGGTRVIADLQVCDVSVGNQCINGKSFGPQADVNNHFAIEGKTGATYKVTILYQGKKVERTVVLNGPTLLKIDL